MVNGLNGSAAGFAVTGVMLLSGLILGGISSQLLKFLGVCDQKESR